MNDLYTKRGEELLAGGGIPWQEYPRPQMVRDSYLNLNGEWQMNAAAITVPFCPESLLSGVHENIPNGAQMSYTKRFSVPEGFIRDRVLLNIGAADQTAEIYVNGAFAGRHQGGYDSFSVDVTGKVVTGDNVLQIVVTDDLNNGVFPYGKQRHKRGGMWYTPVSGIWQTVWLESVPEMYIRRLIITSDAVSAKIQADVGEGVIVTLGDYTPEEPHLWSPEDPYLYHVKVRFMDDEVETYYALRTLEIRTEDGVPRLCLNGRPYFFNGVLDQGYYSDGLFTPASPACYEDDILAMKELGYNTLRKHVKVEPELWYYACDRLGMAVFQDMVNNSDYKYLRDSVLPNAGAKRKLDADMHDDPGSRAVFKESMKKTVEQLGNHPSVVLWTIFNEGWGQFASTEMYTYLQGLDRSRFISSASGWFKGGRSDVDDDHWYFGSYRTKTEEKPVILSEFGGYSCRVPGHIWNDGKEYGYKKFRDLNEWNAAIDGLYAGDIDKARAAGLSAAIYTQLSDVEDETNGILTYDRKVNKRHAGNTSAGTL